MTAAISLIGEPAGMAARLAEILVRGGVLDAEQSRAALARHAQTGAWVGRCAVELGFATDSRVADALAQAFRCPRVVLAQIEVDAAAQAKLDPAFCRANAMLPLALRENGTVLVVAICDPGDRQRLTEAALKSGCTVRPVVATEPEIVAALRAGSGRSPRKAISIAPCEAGELETESLAASLVDAPANDPVERTPAPSTRLPVDAQLAIVNERLQWTETELRRTQRLLRGLLELCLAKNVASRAELSELLAKSRA